MTGPDRYNRRLAGLIARRRLLSRAALGGTGFAALGLLGCSSSNNNSGSSKAATSSANAAGKAPTAALAASTPLRVGGGTPALSSAGVASPQPAVAGTGKPGGTLNVAAFADVLSL